MNCTQLFITVKFYHPWSGGLQCARFIIINTFLFTIGKPKYKANTIITRTSYYLEIYTRIRGGWTLSTPARIHYSCILCFGIFVGLYGELVSSHIDETVKSTTLGSVICNLPDSSTTVFYSRLESQNTPSIYLLQGISIILKFR